MAEILSTVSQTGDKGTPANGGDFYTTLTAWEAAQQGIHTVNDTSTVQCYDDYGVNGLEDILTIADWTNDANSRIVIEAAPGSEIDMRAFTSVASGFKVKGVGAVVATITIAQPYVTIRNIGTWGDSSAASTWRGFSYEGSANSTGMLIDSCSAERKAIGGHSSAVGCFYGSRGGTSESDYPVISNCLAVSTDNNGSNTMAYRQQTSSGRLYYINCVGVINNAIDGAGGRVWSNQSSTAGNRGTCINCVAVRLNGNTNDECFHGNRFSSIEGAEDASNNASSDATASLNGPNPQDNVDPTAIFVDAANGDYFPVALQALENTGTTSAKFSTDALGNTRVAPWDIGAFEIVAAGGVTFDGPDIVAQSGTENVVFTFDENGEGTVASRFTGATSNALSPDSDALPAGLTVNPTTGNIEGTPTEVVTRNIIIRGSE